MDCNEIKTQYQEIKTKQADFHALASDLRKNRVPLVVLKKEIQLWFENNLEMIIYVKNMTSPFEAAYEIDRLPVPERKTQIVDLENQLAEDCAEYYECGLASWAEDIEKGKPRLKKIIGENKGRIARELQEGAIAIFMPGRAVQYANAVETLTKKLKPVLKDYGEEKKVKDGHLTWKHFMEELEKIAREKTANIPEDPYLMLTNTTRLPEFIEMTLDDQLAEIVEKNKKRKKENRPVEFSMMPTEYAAREMFFTARAERMTNEAGDRLFRCVNPLDANFYVRFVSMNKGILGDSLVGYWTHHERQMRFEFGDSTAVSYTGVRLVVRLS